MNNETSGTPNMTPAQGRIIYNVTVKVEHAIAESWLRWLKDQHIPDVIGTGCFTHAVILRLIEVDDTDGPTYAVQYHAPSREDYNHYITSFAEDMRQLAFKKWGEQFVAFRSVLETVHTP